jgi:hypothetical protein
LPASEKLDVLSCGIGSNNWWGIDNSEEVVRVKKLKTIIEVGERKIKYAVKCFPKKTVFAQVFHQFFKENIFVEATRVYVKSCLRNLVYPYYY